MKRKIVFILGIVVLLVLIGLVFWFSKPAPYKLGPPVPVYVVAKGVSLNVQTVEFEARLDKILVTANVTPLKGKGQSKLMLPLGCLLYTSPSPRDRQKSRMPSSA